MRRSVLLFVLVILVVAALSALTPGAGARELLGCDGVIQWPCPGPAL